MLTMVLTADTKEQLDTDTEQILSLSRQKMCQMAVLKYQQTDGLNTALPIGTRRINTFRTLTTESLAVFMPFKVQEIQDKGGIYFGENAISHNLILCNRGEFAPMVQAMGSDIGTVVHVAAGGRDRLNAMYMVEGYGENNPIVEKSQFIMSLVEQIDKNGVGPQHKSIIDRCTGQIYQEAAETGIVPTLSTLREKLLVQPEKIAKEIALSL